MDITGGADTTNLADKNIGVVATPAQKDDQGNVTQLGKLEIKLAKDLQGLNSVTTQTTDNDGNVINKTVQNGDGVTITPKGKTEDKDKISLTTNGLSNGGKQITYVASGLGDTKDISTITDSATLQNAVNVGDLQKVAAAHTAVTVNGSIEAPTVEANNTLGSYTGTDKGNLLLAQKKAENGKVTYDLKLNDTLNLGKVNSKNGDQTVAGVDGSVNVTGKTGASVNINGADGTIGLKGADGANALTVKSNNDASKVGVDGDKGTTRLSYDTKTTVDGTTTTTTHNLATMDDGQKYAGDVQATDAKSNVFGRKINEQTNVVGGVRNIADLSTANNVGVVSNGTDTLTIRLAKKLSGLTSVTTETKDAQGNVTNTTVQNGDGITITPQGKTEAKDKISLTTTGLSNGGKQITYVDSGLKDTAGNTVKLANASGDVLNNAVNVGDLKNAVSDVNGKHTKVTVEGGTSAGTTDYAGKNLKLKSTTENGQTTYDLKLADNLTLGSETTEDSTGKETTGVDGSLTVKGQNGSSVTLNGADGSIGLTGPKGSDGTNGTSISLSTTLNKATLDSNQNVKQGTEDKAPRIQYQYKDDNTTKTYYAATTDDGLKFAGDDSSKTVAKKLNETLQIRGDGTYDTATQKSNGNIVTSVDGDGIKVALSDNINLHKNGTLTLGGDTNGSAEDGTDPITIRHFNANALTVTGKDKDGNTVQSADGDYITGLDNKTWSVENPTYVSGRAVTEDQLKVVSDAVKNAATTAGKHTAITVNDKANATTAAVGTNDYGDYSSADKGNLLIAAKEKDGQTTYNIKLNDQLNIGKKGADGTDGKVTVDTKGGTTVIIGHDGDGKDGLFVRGNDGKDGKDAVSISGKDGVGHIGLTGPKGADGQTSAFVDIFTDYKTKTLNPDKNTTVDGKEKASRIVYKDDKGDHEVATMDDGLNFVGNDGQTVTRKLNSTLSLTGGITDAELKTASSKNLGVRKNAAGDGLEVVMTDTPDFTKVTIGGGTDTTQKIIIGEQTNGTKTNETGKYITGLDNTTWDKDNVVANRAATEGQLRDFAGSITNQSSGGGFALASEEKDASGNHLTVKQDLGKAIELKGDTTYKADGSVDKPGNIKTSVDNGSIKISLNKDVDLGPGGSVKTGATTINNAGVTTNKVQVGDISITKDGINGGSKQISNIASGLNGKTYDTTKDGQQNWNNAASIGDVHTITNDIKRNVTNVTDKVDKMDQHIGQIDQNVTQLQQDVHADRQYQGDDAAKGKLNVKFGSFLRLTGGADSNALTGEGNIGVIQQEKDGVTGLSVRLAKHLNLEKTTYATEENGEKHQTEVDSKGLTISHTDASGKANNIVVREDNVSMGGNQIHNVAPGSADDDAVNVSQLKKLGGEVSNVSRRVDRVGAGAAALAALHPQDFDPDDKWDFAVGYGNYRGANAAAVGAFYQPNEDTTLSIGGTVGGGENMINAGISFKFGQGNHVTNSRVAMAKEILALKDFVEKQNTMLQQQNAKIEKLEAMVGAASGTPVEAAAVKPQKHTLLFPDVPENHWAYSYVKKLSERGLLEGYPDGEFKGNRTLTRYEFAAIVARALENGAAADEDMQHMAEEFDTEIRELSLSRFRVDRVAGDDNDRHKIERVRVNDRDEEVQKKNGEKAKIYRDIYGEQIEKAAEAVK
ncbi:S-layer homology domain-containing protein [Mitsuokella sp.]|uniref:beta strand repeat-containing protein n=1 Tax=Mitsuokella sp. TaxID=2049034 RepID=UPI003D7C5990